MVSGAGVLIEVLGTLRVFDAENRDLTPEGELQRRLLALLVLSRGSTVSVDVAIEVLWPVQRPRDPVAALQNQVFRLRRRLPEGIIESTRNGYALAMSQVDLDADRLAEALNADGLDAAAVASIDEALQRWRGPAYPELDDVDDGRIEAARLEELRRRAVEARAVHKLAAGDAAEVIADVAALAQEDPLRERPVALLMAALAQAGRHAEALRVYDDFRRVLGDEMGIEPSPSLAAQHTDLLAGTGLVGWNPAERLPVPATTLIGRDKLVAVVVDAVQAHRVVTLVGPGGVGKTRASLAVGHRLRAAREDRPVIMCELAAGGEHSAIDVIAAGLRIDARPGVDLVDRVVDVLGDAPMVLILDNCEHTLDTVASVVERLVSGCPNTRVLATSRERLRVPGEAVRAVPTLPCAGDDAPAVQLFVQRAREVVPDFEPSAEELAGIAEIAQRLDGLPLAIELAAARLHTHDITEVAAALDQRFSLLSSGYRTSSRHGSLSAAVSWSYDLLDEELRRTFADLSVFVGSFTTLDVAAITNTDLAMVTAALTQLVERSLVMRTADHRYVLLETLRAFGAEQLAETGQAEQVGGRHARHLVDWVQRAQRRFVEPGEPVIEEIDAALPELHVALGWLVDHGEAELAGRLVAALLDYGFLRLRPDVLAWSERVTAIDPDDRSPVSSTVWVVAAYAAWMAGDVAETGVRSARALATAERDGSDVPPEVASIMGSHDLFEGRLDEAARWFRRAADTATIHSPHGLLAAAAEVLALGYARDPAVGLRADALLAEVGESDTPYAAYAWYSAGEADLAGDDLTRARARFVRAIDVAERTNASFMTGLAGASKASIDARLGDPVRAAEDFRRLVAHWRRAGMWSSQWTMLRSIAGLLARLGRRRDAAVLVGAVRATGAGHRIFGADEVALQELARRLRHDLGDDAYEAAAAEGAVLDGDAAVEHALRAL